MSTFYVGVDSAKATFSVATSWQAEVTYQDEWVNTCSACAAFCQAMEALAQDSAAQQLHLIIEPTGGYETQLVAEAYRRGWWVTRVNPLSVRNWARGMGKRAKTDRQDAQLLAQYGSEVKPSAQEALDKTATELDSLLRRQAGLEKHLRSERNRQGQAESNVHTSDAVRQSLQRTIDALSQELATIQEAMRELTTSDVLLAQFLKLLRTIPGVGQKLAPILLVAIMRFLARTGGKGTAKQLVAYAGLDPAPYDSGTSVKKRATISKQGDGVLRSTLYMAALGGMRGHNRLNHVYNSLLARGKAKKLALIACARKILVWAWAVFTNRTPFDPSRFDPQSETNS